jgi:hypothetical protein
VLTIFSQQHSGKSASTRIDPREILFAQPQAAASRWNEGLRGGADGARYHEYSVKIVCALPAFP